MSNVPQTTENMIFKHNLNKLVHVSNDYVKDLPYDFPKKLELLEAMKKVVDIVGK